MPHSIKVMEPELPPPSSFGGRLKQVQRAGIFSNFGPQVSELEARFAEKFSVGVKNVVAMANATLALEGLTLLNTANHFAVPSWTFAATPLSVLRAGKTFEWADVDEASQMVDAKRQRKSALIATLAFGQGIPENWLAGDCPVIIDGAASIGNVGSLREFPSHSSIVFSLHATKYLGAGEGAIVVCGSSALARALRAWSNFGFEGKRDSSLPGTNAKMSEFQAVVAHAVLDLEPVRRERWFRIRERAVSISKALGIGIPLIDSAIYSPYWIVKFTGPEKLEKVEKFLTSEGVETRRWWSAGCHRMPVFESITAEGSLNTTALLASTTLGLPFHTNLSTENFSFIETGLRRALLG